MCDEIDLIQLIKYIWLKRKIVLYSLILAGILGLCVAIFSTPIYEASVVFVTQENSRNQNTNGLSGLAAMAGVNLSSASNNTAFPVELYSTLVGSEEFKKDLMNKKILIEGDSLSLYQYNKLISSPSLLDLVLKYTIGLPSLIMKKSDSSDTTSNIQSNTKYDSISKSENNVLNWLDESIELLVDDETNSITVKSRFNSPFVAAEIANIYVNLLQEKIIDFQLKKSRVNLSLIKGRYLNKKSEVESLQNKIATYQDMNKNLTSTVSQLNFQRLNQEYTLINSVYTELSKQYEQAKMQIQKDTPVFAIIDPVTLPLNRKSPQRLKIFFVFIIGGLILGCALILSKLAYYNIQKKWNQ